MIVEGFLGNHRRDDYATVVSNLIESYEKFGCRMSLKLYFFHFHMDFFQDNFHKNLNSGKIIDITKFLMPFLKSVPLKT